MTMLEISTMILGSSATDETRICIRSYPFLRFSGHLLTVVPDSQVRRGLFIERAIPSIDSTSLPGLITHNFDYNSSSDSQTPLNVNLRYPTRRFLLKLL